MKSNIAISIEPHEDGVRCGKCIQQDWGPRDHSCNLFGGIEPHIRHAKCLQAEQQLRNLIAAGDATIDRRDSRKIETWNAAKKAMEDGQ